MAINWGQIIASLAKDFCAGAAPAKPSPAPKPVTTTGPTGAQLSAGISAILPALTAIQTAMASPQFQAAVIASEDIEQVLAIFGVPGAAAAETVTEEAVQIAPDAIAAARLAVPFLTPIVTGWSTSGAFAAAPNMHPVGTAGSKPIGIV